MAEENEYVPFQGGLTIEEFIDSVQNEITVTCMLPKELPDAEIRRLIEVKALPYFYRRYQYSLQKLYWFINKKALSYDDKTKYAYINVPCEIQNVVYLYKVSDASLLELGINNPNLSVNLGVTNQPYLSSYVSTIGELGVYKTAIDNLSDMLDHLNLYTVRHDFNQLNHRINLLTHVETHLIMEAYARIPQENLFKDDLFFNYVVGYAKIQYGNLTNRYDFNYPGGVKINGADLISQGKEEVKEVKEEVESISDASFFFMVRR